MSLAVTLMIVIQSLIATKCFLALAKWNNFKSNSKLMVVSTFYISMIDFLYNGIIFLLTPVLNYDLFPLFKNGTLSQGFNQYWFTTIGSLVIKNMIMIPLVPVIMELVSWLLRAKVL